MLVEMTSRIIQHGSLRRRVIFFVRMEWPRAFWGKSSRKLLLHVQETFQKPNTLGTTGFLLACDEELRDRRLHADTSSAESRSRSLFKTQPKAETAHERPLAPRVETKGHFQGMPNTYHPVDKMPFNLSLMKSQAINISKDKRRHKYMYSSFTWA